MPRPRFAAAARYPIEIEDAGPEGEAARREVGRLTYEINVQQYACAGLNFGSYYDRSPIIAYDGAEHPAYTMNSYTPSTVPGCRTPHLWCDDGRSLYDAMGPEFTLLRFDPALDVAPLEAAARDEGSTAEGARHATPNDRHFLWRRTGVVAAGPARGLARRYAAGGSARVDRSRPRRCKPG